MVYKKEYDSMSIVELISVCLEQGIDYYDGDSILDAKAIRDKLGKKQEKE